MPDNSCVLMHVVWNYFFRRGIVAVGSRTHRGSLLWKQPRDWHSQDVVHRVDRMESVTLLVWDILHHVLLCCDCTSLHAEIQLTSLFTGVSCDYMGPCDMDIPARHLHHTSVLSFTNGPFASAFYHSALHELKEALHMLREASVNVHTGAVLQFIGLYFREMFQVHG